MTKAIRIENADNSDHKVVVQVWEKGRDLDDGLVEPDKLIEEYNLNNPTAMIEKTIWTDRYLVIKEV